jgi:hypothetical protein
MRDGTNSLLVIMNRTTDDGTGAFDSGGTNYTWLKTSLSPTTIGCFDGWGNKVAYNNGIGFGQMPIYLVATNTATNVLYASLSTVSVPDTNAPVVAFTRFPTAAEAGWVKWIAQDDVAIIPRIVSQGTNEMRYAWNTGTGWSAWTNRASIEVSPGPLTVSVAAKDFNGNASTNILYLGGAYATNQTGNVINNLRVLGQMRIGP